MLFFVITSCSSCYAYVPSDLAAIRPAQEIRLEVSRVGFAKLPQMPEQPGPDIAGTVVRADPEQVILRVPVHVRSDGMVTGTIQQDVIIPSSDIVDVTRREFSRKRTALVTAGGLGILAGLFTAFGHGGAPSGDVPDKPGDQEAGAQVIASLPFLQLLLR